MARWIVLVWWCWNQWCPVLITAALDRGDGTPEVVVVLGSRHGNVAIGECHVQHREQPRILPWLQPLLGRDRSRDAAPLQRRVFQPKQRDLGLVGGSGTGRGLAIAAQRLHFL